MRTLALSLRLVTIAASTVTLLVCPTNAAGTLPGRNGRIAFSTGGNVFTIRSDGGGLRVVADGHGPVWSPDGRWIAYALRNRVYVVPAEGGRRRLVIASAVSPTWSPSGRRLAVVRRSGIWMVGRDGRNPRRLIDVIPDSSGLDWSPDGSRIVFSHHHTIVEVSVGSGALTTIPISTAVGGDCPENGLGSPTWSPDGSRLAVAQVITCGRLPNKPISVSTIAIVDTRSGTVVAGIGADVGSPYDWGSLLPSWSPDGRSLAFLHDVSDSNGVIVLTVFDLESRTSHKVRRLPSNLSSEAARPDWQRLP